MNQRDIRAKKSLGQHFLNNNFYLNRIVDSSMKEVKKLGLNTINVVEIGPGTGLLTNHLLKIADKMLCIEKDTQLYSKLIERYHDNKKVQFINADALEIDISELEENKVENQILIANLPYNVSVPLMINFFQNTKSFKAYCVLIQKEVALRLAAKPNTKDYGRLSILAQTYCDVKLCFDIAGNVFTPSTKVTSTFVILLPKQNVDVDYNKLSYLAQLFFNYRRKMIRGTVGKSNPEIMSMLMQLNIKDSCRAEDISVLQFQQLSKMINL